MKPHPILKLLPAALVLAGCAAPFGSQADPRDIELARIHSPEVLVQKVWIERSAGGLFVRGFVGRRFGGSLTTLTHLDVTLTDPGGNVLRRSAETFSPNPIPQVARRFDHAAYRVALDPLPEGTARIEIRAHEGPIPCTG